MSLHTLNSIEQCRVVIDSIAYFKLNFEKKCRLNKKKISNIYPTFYNLAEVKMFRNDSVHCIWTLIDISECIFSALSSDIYCAHFQHPKSRAVSDFWL